MNKSIVATGLFLPAIVRDSDTVTTTKFLEFFTANIRNPNTRKAYGKAVGLFLSWCETQGVQCLFEIQPIHVAAWMEEALAEGISPPHRETTLSSVARSVRLDGSRPGHAD